MLSFEELEVKYGEVLAYQYLVEIERAAHIPSGKMKNIDPEIRLANAICVQDVFGASPQPLAA
ncbi:MAG: hypothetical protein WCD70_16955 [Alphaproteobacteria bacterium]